MASKRSRPLDDPPAASSSEEEETEDEEEEEEEEELMAEKPQSKPQPEPAQSEEEEESEKEDEEEESEDEDDEEEQQKQKKQNEARPMISPNPNKNPQQESSSESDSPKSPRASDFTIKPIAHKSVEEKIATPVSKPSSKRRAENGKASKSKKAKSLTEIAAEEEEDGGGNATPADKKSAFSRLWSEEDEIAILKGLIEFHAKNGKDPSTHQQEFHEFVKGSLHVDASKSQVMDKVRRLKKKFRTNMEKSTNGKDPVISKPHEYKAFQFSKKIWGNPSDKKGVDDNANVLCPQEKSNTREKPSVQEKPSSGRNSRKNISDSITPVDANASAITAKEEDLPKLKSDKVELNEGKEEDFGKLYPFLMSAFRPDYIPDMSIAELVKSNLSLVGSSELKELDNKWKKQNAAEMEVFLGRVDLVREGARMVLDAMKSSKS